MKYLIEVALSTVKPLSQQEKTSISIAVGAAVARLISNDQREIHSVTITEVQDGGKKA